jgi:hypothetical protein
MSVREGVERRRIVSLNRSSSSRPFAQRAFGRRPERIRTKRAGQPSVTGMRS